MTDCFLNFMKILLFAIAWTSLVAKEIQLYLLPYGGSEGPPKFFQKSIFTDTLEQIFKECVTPFMTFSSFEVPSHIELRTQKRI